MESDISYLDNDNPISFISQLKTIIQWSYIDNILLNVMQRAIKYKDNHNTQEIHTSPA